MRSSVSSLALLCAALLFFSSPVVQGQDSTPISLLSEPLWQMLSKSTTDLPLQIDSLESSFQMQIDWLQANNGRLSSKNSELQNSNNSLMQQNADLTNSLGASQSALGISELLRKQLETDLQDSMQSTIQAQADARALELQNSLLKIGGVVVLVAGADMALKAFTGKDVIEWAISLFK
jgi:hypothetical protein